MRHLFISSAALAVLYAVAAWAYVLPPLKPAPVFYENVDITGQIYTCISGPKPSIFIRFQNEGRTAFVRADSHTVRLTYETSNFMDDIYRRGSWLLTLDSEANLTGPNGLRFGSCY